MLRSILRIVKHFSEWCDIVTRKSRVFICMKKTNHTIQTCFYWKFFSSTASCEPGTNGCRKYFNSTPYIVMSLLILMTEFNCFDYRVLWVSSSISVHVYNGTSTIFGIYRRLVHLFDVSIPQCIWASGWLFYICQLINSSWRSCPQFPLTFHSL